MDIEILEDAGENWASMFRYSSFLVESQYPQAFAALEKALAYFNLKGFPPQASPASELFFLLISIVNEGGIAAFLETRTLNPIAFGINGSTVFASYTPANGDGSGFLSEAGAEEDDSYYSIYTYN